MLTNQIRHNIMKAFWVKCEKIKFYQPNIDNKKYLVLLQYHQYLIFSINSPETDIHLKILEPLQTCCFLDNAEVTCSFSSAAVLPHFGPRWRTFWDVNSLGGERKKYYNIRKKTWSLPLSLPVKHSLPVVRSLSPELKNLFKYKISAGEGGSLSK